MIPGQPHLDFTEAMLQSRTVVIVFLIVLAMLFAFVAANEIAERWHGSMARYHLHEIGSRWKSAHEARKCSARIDRQLRSHGFTEVSHGRWEKRG